MDAEGQRVALPLSCFAFVSRSRYYKSYWRTCHMSDYLAMWIELRRTDFGKEYLSEKIGG